MTADLAREVALVWSWFHRLTGAVADAYATEMRDRSANRFALRRRLLRALANVREADEEDEAATAAAKLGFRPAAEFVALVVGPLDEAQTERLDTELAGCGFPALALFDAGRASVLGQGSADRLIATIRGLEPEAPIGIGLARAGVRGAAATLVDAAQSWTMAVAAGRDVHFGEEWLPVLLHAERSRLEPLLAAASAAAVRHPALADTVRAYADCAYSVSACARLLGIHPNTATYRLDRWRALTGWDVREFTGLAAPLAALDRSRLTEDES